MRVKPLRLDLGVVTGGSGGGHPGRRRQFGYGRGRLLAVYSVVKAGREEIGNGYGTNP